MNKRHWFIRMPLCLLIMCLITLLGGSSAGLAHPHVFAVGGAELVVNDQRLSEVRVHWTFDEFISSAAIGFAIEDRPLRLDEGKGFWGEGLPAPDALKYYVQIDVDGARYETIQPRFFGMYISGGCIHYTYTVPVDLPVENLAKVWFSDPSNYIAFSIDNNQCILTRETGSKGELRVNEEQYIKKANLFF